MNKLRISALVTGSVVCLSLASVAVAGPGGGQRGQHGMAGEALAEYVFARLDANQDGRVTRAEVDGEAQRIFARMDANKDSELTQSETAEGVGVVAREEIEARFKSLDTNADGRVTAAESKLPARFFARLDKNSDQAVTRDEIQAAPKLGAKGSEFAFKALDANRDGKVTRAEGTELALSRFDYVDTNRDGAITRAELDAQLEQKGKRRGKHERRSGSKR